MRKSAIFAFLYFLQTAVSAHGAMIPNISAREYYKFKETPSGNTAISIMMDESPLPPDSCTATNQALTNSKLEDIKTKLDAADSSLDSVEAAFDVALSTRASEATLQSFRSENGTKLDVANANLVTIQGKQDTGNGYLASIDGKVSTAAKQDTGNASLASIDLKVATESTLLTTNSKLDTIHADALVIEGKQDTGNTTLSNIKTDTAHLDVNTSTRASESTLSSFQSANHTDQLGIQTRQDTTNSSIGATSETVAATDTTTSGINGLFKRLLQRITTLIAFYSSNFGADSGGIRVNSQIGNSTGAASFGAGATSAQTVRVAANTYDGAGNAVTSRVYDSTRPLDVYLTQIGASNATHTRVTLTANVSVQIAAANSARKWLYIDNQSGANIFIKFGTAAVINQELLVSNGTTFIMRATELYLGTINAIVGSNGRTIGIVEGY